MKKVLGFNISHNVSCAYFEDDVLKEYYEEDRFNKIKHFSPPHPFYEKDYDYEILKKFKDVVFDCVAIASYDMGDILIEKPYVDNVLRQLKFKENKFYFREHHLFHAVCGFYFSKFKEALVVTCDGGGERFPHKDNFQTMEAIFQINNKELKALYKHSSNIRHYLFRDYKHQDKFDFLNDVEWTLTNRSIGGFKYLDYLYKAGFKTNEEGQMMGIAAYKDKDTNLDKDVLKIAHEAQEVTLQERIKLIEKAMTYSDCKNIILSGGYHLNCLNNFKLVKHFPKLKFFVDPIPYDGGTAVGAAFYYVQNYKNQIRGD
tara:strand:- start:162 stop:1106 length:945 start_codon:yes stop_codon:yes gene_type:complete